ncbi:Dolichyl-phosphate beta-glucosyltransferase [Citrus sinensis]|uniref:Dolichyl-phosphate beta-glucosyltransferase n=1 Tax=Citrus sinensis TaxID=2711 RepID=A0ACB8L353_CITSI|nr:Dolichyl-phosphate beta-glucosyltransferase [Citrus sinensis]
MASVGRTCASRFERGLLVWVVWKQYVNGSIPLTQTLEGDEFNFEGGMGGPVGCMVHFLTHNADVKLEPKDLASIKKLKQQPKAQDQIEIFGVSPKNLTSIKKPDDGVIQRDVGKIRKPCIKVALHFISPDNVSVFACQKNSVCFPQIIGLKRENWSHIEAPAIFEDPSSLKQVPCPSVTDPAEKYISLIIPAFNEEHRLPGALDETLNYLQQRAAKDKSFTYEVLIIDDGSSDGTKRVAFDFVRKYTVDNVRIILLGRNHGKGEAIRKGMLHSRGELLLMLDADGATKVTDLEKLESQIHAVGRKEYNHGDSVTVDSTFRISDIPIAAFGSRAHLEEKALATRKWYRNFLMKGFHLVVILTAGPGIRDTQCGFKMFTRAAARKLFTNIRLKRWCFDVELVYLCKRFGIPIIEISVNWSEIPGSKVNPLSIPNMLWELALMSVGYRTVKALKVTPPKNLFIMLNILSNNSIMASPIFHNFKTQASFYFKEKIRTARLAITDVTLAELLTEEATNGNPWPPDTRTMNIISRAAFEVDDYWRIVEILHQRLLKFDKKNWRASYNALILLEHLLTHGPKRIAEEFQSDHEDVIKQMGNFQYIDEKGFNWGSSVTKLSQRILELLQSEQLLTEERARARKLTREIKGFGSFSKRSSSDDYDSFRESLMRRYGRSSSYYNYYQNQRDKFLDLKESLLIDKSNEKEENSIKKALPEKPRKNWITEKHLFFDNDELGTKTSLLSDTD